MSKGRGVVVLFLILVITGCGHGGNSGARNVLTVSVPASSSCNILNAPCVSVTICSPINGSCRTIPDILVDTGSSGLRVFSSLLNLNLLPASDGSGLPIGECVVYVDGSAEWGPVRIANVILGNEPSVTVPIQAIESSFAGGPSPSCGTVRLLNAPGNGVTNGVLGIGIFQYDQSLYFSCTSSACVAINPNPLLSLPASSFVQNPVFLLPTDNNGVILSFPSIPDTGARSVSGTLTLGIGTSSNNQPGNGVLLYAATPVGALTTVYGGTTYSSSVIDSGTNVFGIPSDIPINICTGVNAGFLCPAVTMVLTVANQASNGSEPSVAINIANMDNVYNSNFGVYNDIAIDSPAGWGFFFGFPFFLGRTIYFGYDQQPTP